jgi:hypothetical protein
LFENALVGGVGGLEVAGDHILSTSFWPKRPWGRIRITIRTAM